MTQAPDAHNRRHDDLDPNCPPARAADESSRNTKPDQLPEEHRKDAEDRQEALIDEALDESFPASDPPTPKNIT